MYPHFSCLQKEDINLAQGQIRKAACRHTCRNTVRVWDKPNTSLRELKQFILMRIKLCKHLNAPVCSYGTWKRPCLSSAGIFNKNITRCLLSITVRFSFVFFCVIWLWSAWQQLYQLPCHTQSCCAGKTEVWWKPGKRRRWKSSCSRLAQLICKGGQTQRWTENRDEVSCIRYETVAR